MHSTSLHFNNVQDIQYARHINTDELLKQGSLTVGNHSYSVRLATDGSIAVNRDHHSSGMKRFFSSAKEALTHRMMEGSDISRSDRIADSLNAHARYNRLQTLQAQRQSQIPQSSMPQQRFASKPTASGVASRPTVLARAQSDPTPVRPKPLMSQGEYRDQLIAQYEQDGYDSPHESTIRESYRNYVATNRPAPAQSAPAPHRSQSAPLPKTELSPLMTKDEFGREMTESYEKDGYDSPHESLIKERYQDYVATNRPQVQRESAVRPIRTQSAVTAPGLMDKREFASIMVAQYHRDGYDDPSEFLINESYNRYVTAEQSKASSARAKVGMTRSQSDTQVELIRHQHDRIKNSIGLLSSEGLRKEAGSVLRSFRRASNEFRLSAAQQQQILSHMEKLVGGLWGNAQQSVNGLRILKQQLESIREHG